MISSRPGYNARRAGRREARNELDYVRPRYLSRENREARVKSNVHVRSMDMTIYIVVVILAAIGVIMVFSASYVRAANAPGGNAFYFLTRHGGFAIAGFIIMNIIANTSYEIIRPFTWIIYFITLGLLVAVIVTGQILGGAARWVYIPFVGQFQPSEIAKASLILLIAFLTEKYPMALRTWSGLFIFGGLVAVPVMLIAAPGGFSTALIVGFTGFLMIFVASPHIWRFILGGAGAVGAIAGYLWWEFSFGGGFRGRRVYAWLNPFDDPLGIGRQIIQSIYAVASGGWLGLGIGQSRQTSFLPLAHNDMIFAIIVEELGFVGAAMLIVLFGMLIWRGVIVALRAPDVFSYMTALGIVFMFAFQTIIHIGVTTNTIPNTGVTLPFISYGGTSLIVNMALAGILLNISKYSKDKNQPN